jgi:hypothetical protein
MIPVLLDLLTIFFLVAGMVLLWLNLRMWRATGLSITPENYDRPEDRKQSSPLPPREAESLMTWSTPFDDPIDLPDGRKLITLRDAATYITELPEAERQECQIAAQSLIDAAEHQDLIKQAYIDVLRAIRCNEVSPPIPIGKTSIGESESSSGTNSPMVRFQN